MRTYESRPKRYFRVPPRNAWHILPLLVMFCGVPSSVVRGQATNEGSLSSQIQKLTESMARTQAQLEQSQRQLNEMRQQLDALQRQMAQGGSTGISPAAPSSSVAESSSIAAQTASPDKTAAIDDIRERQAMQASQIATHEQAKVESESKYPVKVTGLLLLNGFVNTRRVDTPATPTVATPGSGSTGASVRQTVLGIRARGPHLFGAYSYADLNVDFDGRPQSASSTVNYAGYGNSTLLRLRTAHAGLQWQHTEAYFSFDRPIFSPDAPSSLTAVAEPPLAWSGNLWTWNSQVAVTRDIEFAGSHNVRLQAALIDVGDAPLSPVNSSATSIGRPPTTAERSRWPGAEARISLSGSKPDEGNHLGFGGYFAPHLSSQRRRFNSWAGTLDARLLLPGRLELSGSFYRGEALGGLGGGGYKDFVYRSDPDSGKYYFRPLDDIGGWAQLKEKISERVEFNAAFGLDNVFARELRSYAVPDGSTYQNLARNRTYTGNVIYAPSAYLLFSLEYRHLQSFPVIGLPAESDVIGVGAGYKF